MRLLLLALTFTLSLPVAAQDDALGLPDWAAPSVPSAEAPAVAPVDGPGLPSAPTPVPLDGGLGLLALAGGVYAARRLRQRATE
ncbi:MAG: hypothetical protein Rubg2KO_00490 [Rubricoccaceae bacterium]